MIVATADSKRKSRISDSFLPCRTLTRHFDRRAWFVYGLCMATKTISIETDAYDLLAQEKKDRTESFSRVIRRLFAERPALTAGDLLDVMQEFRGKGAGARRKRR
jgi:predicted CopG family antitoxin